MDTKDIINGIVSMPHKFYVEQDKSIYTLLKETGYFKEYSKIKEEDILTALIEYPDHVQYWRQWSDDKRTSSGWYFTYDSDGRYSVKYFPATSGFETKAFRDEKKACAHFIIREIEEIRAY